ncbi:MAG: thioredoxin family protein [Planctomycetota bacterium]
MRLFFVRLLALSLISIALHCNYATAQIQWKADIQQASREASESGKLVLLHFGADWCRPCRNLETFVFNSPAVYNVVNDSVVPVKIDVDLHPDLVAEFGVDSVPFDVIATPSGRVVSQRRSPQTTDGYANMIKAVERTMGDDGGTPFSLTSNSTENPASQNQSAFPPGSFVPQVPAHSAPSHAGPSHSHPSPAGPSHSMQPPANPGFSAQGEMLAQRSAGYTQPVRNPYANDDMPSDRRQFAPPASVDRQQQIRNAYYDGPQPAENTPEYRLANSGTTHRSNLVDRTMPAPPNPGADLLQTEMPTYSNQPGSELYIPPRDDNSRQRMDIASRGQQSGFGLQGNCPVTLVRNAQWIQGDERWGCIHRGRTYIFASEGNMVEFQANPDKYSPLLAGYDPVIYHDSGILVEGREEHGVFMGRLPNQRVILFNTAESRNRFESAPAQYIETVRQAMLNSSPTNLR